MQRKGAGTRRGVGQDARRNACVQCEAGAYDVSALRSTAFRKTTKQRCPR